MRRTLLLFVVFIFSLYLYRRESAETELLDPYDSSASAAVMTFLSRFGPDVSFVIFPLKKEIELSSL